MSTRYKDISYGLALSAPGVGGRKHNNFRIGAVLRCNGNVYHSCNSYKTSPRLLRYYKFPFYHAEAACILKAGLENCKKGIMYITRIKRDNSLALSRPCLECMYLINLAKLKEVVYSTEIGYEYLDW